MDARWTSPNDWRYVSEGGATIVFSYVGAYDPNFTGMVLRIRKVSRSEISPEELLKQHENEDEDSQYAAEDDDPTVAFQSRIISRLVPSEHLPRLESCRVSLAFLSKLSLYSQSYRPLERIARDSIDTRKRRAVLATDLVGAGAGGFAVEIKPKWAFLPNPKYLSLATKEVKLAYSRFVMHSHYRSLREQSVAEKVPPVTDYDPLDLFSGDEKRVEMAVEALWASWVASNGAVNNLRVFLDGKMIKPNDEGAYQSLSKLLAIDSALSSSEAPRQPFIQALLPLLLRKPLLKILETLQRTLDSLDIEGLLILWDRAHAASNPPPQLGEGEPEPTLFEWESFVDEYLPRTGGGAVPGLDNLDLLPAVSDLRYHMLAYLMSATFKDCSVILRFPSLEARDLEPCITVIDLDPKSVARLHKWAQLDREIAETYSEHVAKQKGSGD
ncbi:inositol-pentakisphosphate 2-kinase [Cantharellus anzutake]|uniref:inositol-pentakisphosphate 2-kinase n=1 Tax=Cantharellus anzutake TaxID=1750568 RepID=UPI001907AF43|nr:inositol-pentakisphosphate 2-kinase [Cantharellus anzutake]KAF8320587.1 inositol-pentakisphosphate 2-kinase [Cantharellus anzutake]